MQVLSRNIPTVKTETADVHSLLHARVNGNGYAPNGRNGHRHRPRRQIRNNRRHAAYKADTAVILVENGMGATEAVKRCTTSTNYFSAMRVLRESENVALLNAVLSGAEPVLASAEKMKNAAQLITAFRAASPLEREVFRAATGATNDPVTMLLNLPPDQLVAVSKALGLDWVWDWMIAAAMPASNSVNVA